MNLYLLTQHTVEGFATFDRAVVAAPDVNDARGTHPAKCHKGDLARDCWVHIATNEHEDVYDSVYGWPARPSEVEVELIGVANAHIEAGVICASFHEG